MMELSVRFPNDSKQGIRVHIELQSTLWMAYQFKKNVIMMQPFVLYNVENFQGRT